MVLQDGFFDKYHCERCDNQYAVMESKWCKLCKSSGNKQIDDFIENKSTKFELITYNQFDNIEEIGRNDFTKICSAIWNDGPLFYDCYDHKYKKSQNKKVTLKYPYNSQNRTGEFLNEV